MAISGLPMSVVKDPSAAASLVQRVAEKATQTFLLGTPVSIDSGTGCLQVWDGTTGVAFVYATANRQGGIVGIACEPASNLGSNGAGITPFSPFTGLGAAAGTQGGIPNQTSAKTIFHGSPINDSRCGIYIPAPNAVFSAVFGNNGNTATPALTDVGKSYGLTIDSGSNFWYVDKNKSTPGTNTVLKVVGLDPRDVVAAGSRVLFTFDQQFIDNLFVM